MVNEYNEISYAKKMLEVGFLSNRRMYELSILAKYLFFQGNSRDEVYNKLVSFCNDNFVNFNEIKYFNKLSSIVQSAQKTNPIEVGSIGINQEDVDYVESFNQNSRFNKVLFSLLVVKKIRLFLMQEPYLNCKYSKFSKICRLNKTQEIYPIIKQMEELGIVRVCRNSNLEILVPETKGGSIFYVYDFDNLACYWMNYKGSSRYTHCESCGKIIRLTGKWRKYCDDCAQDRHRESSRESKKKSKS